VAGGWRLRLVPKSALEALYARCAIQIDTFTFFTLMCISRVTFLMHVLVNILANSVSYLLMTDYKI